MTVNLYDKKGGRLSLIDWVVNLQTKKGGTVVLYKIDVMDVNSKAVDRVHQFFVCFELVQFYPIRLQSTVFIFILNDRLDNIVGHR